MKKLLLAVCLMFGGATLVSAQDDQTSTSTQTQTQAQTQDQDRQQISVSELPDAVTAKLESQDYSGWTVGSAYKKMDESNQEMYIVELKQGAETKKVKFDRDGNQIEKDKQHHDKADANYRNESEAADQSMDAEDTQSPESDVQSPESTESTTESADQATDTESSEQSSETQSTEQSTEQADNAGTEQQQK